MSFVSQVLSTATQADVEIFKLNVPVLTQKLSTFTSDVTNYIDDCYRKFLEWPESREDFAVTLANLTADLQDLQQQMDNITTKKGLAKLNDKLTEMRVELKYVTLLVDIHELFMKSRSFQEVDDCFGVVGEVCKLEKRFASVAKAEFTEILKLLHYKLIMEKSAVWCQMDKIYEKNLVLLNNDTGNSIMSFIKVKKSYNFSELLKAYTHLSDGHVEHLDVLSSFILKNYCELIIQQPNTELSIKDKDDFAVLVLLVRKTSTSRVEYKDIYKKLLNVFKFLNTNFAYEFENFKSTRYLGDRIAKYLPDMLIKNCLGKILSKDLLKTPAGETNLKEIRSDSLLFQDQLVKLHILPQDSTEIADYVNNLKTVVIKQISTEHFRTAITITKQDLHNFVKVSKTGPHNIANFPNCCVSNSVFELLKLIEHQLEKSVKENDLSKHNLVYTAQSILNHYPNLVYEHHKKLLKSNPQQAALYRNNCTYIAFKLVQFAETFKDKVSNNIFTHQVMHLKEKGGQIFSKYVERQVKQMEVTLTEHQFNTHTLSDQLDPDMDKCILQCMEQLEQLKTAWREILPLATFKETLSYLLNTFCKKLIDLVVATEDLPSKNAQQLADMCKIIVATGPKLFDDPNEICSLVHNWQKLKDLVFILCGNLSDIDDGWANGKGPLTLHFGAKEVRRLIKALFPDTDRRGAVLNRICD